MIELLTDERIHQVHIFPWRKEGLSFADLLLENMRHVQEHGAQMSMLLGQRVGISSRWLAKARDEGGN